MRGKLRTGLILVAMVAGVVAGAGAVRAEPAAVTLEQAIRQEQTTGDVDAAMKLYQQIIDNAQADRPAQAQAMYRLALCQQKKDDKAKAIELLQKLTQQYPEQAQTLALARAELAKLQPPARATAPFVVRTDPPAFQTDVNPSAEAMSVTFSQPMTDQSWSWTGGGDTYPKSERPAYDAERLTCSRKVKLEPGKVYWVGVNSPSFRNFRSAGGVPAPWYIILFATRTADGKATPIPQDMLQQAKRINQAHDAARLAAMGDSTPQTPSPATAPAAGPANR